ncbi:MAG: hypothetical protein Q7R41_00935, partial [Phycisphaerales bacterium]|nr:hypothetical protein [Phycisphaerales bacterium]
MSMMWRPAKFFAASSVLCMALMAALAFYPLESWVRAGRLQEDTIYRLLFCSLLGTFGATLLSAGVLCEQLCRLWDARPRAWTFVSAALDRAYTFRSFGVALAVCVPLLTWLIGHGVWTRLTAGYVDVHWSRVVLAGLIAFSLGQMVVTVLIANLIRFHIARRGRVRKMADLRFEISDPPRQRRRTEASISRLPAESQSSPVAIEATDSVHAFRT